MALGIRQRRKIVFIVYIITTLLGVKGQGPLCYECTHLPFAKDCGKVTQCGPNEKCYGMRYATSDGHVFHRLGCLAKEKCAALTSVGKRADIPLCEDCCAGDYCNLEACDSPTGPRNRCLACDNVLHPSDCNLSKTCDLDEVCYTEEIFNINGEKRYRLGCTRKSTCGDSSSSQSSTLVGVGKRQNSLPIDTTYCAQCCDARSLENCNRDLCSNKNITHNNLLAPPPLLVCYDIDGAQCQAYLLLRPQACENDIKVRNLLCPRTCGVCSGAGNPIITFTTTSAPATVPPVFNECSDSLSMCVNFTEFVCSTIPEKCNKTCGRCNSGAQSTYTTRPLTTSTPVLTTPLPQTSQTTTVVTTPQCKDPIPTCKCRYMDEKMHLCNEVQNEPALLSFCCYYCLHNATGLTTCDPRCETAEAEENKSFDHSLIQCT